MHSPEATVTLVPFGNEALPKEAFKKPRFPFLNFKKLIYDTVDICNFVINKFNPTFEVQKNGNEAFQNALFGNASFPYEALGWLEPLLQKS